MSPGVEQTPSEWKRDADSWAKHLRKIKGLDVAAVLVVEGKTDKEFLKRFCAYGADQILFVEGRINVEGVLHFHRDEPNGHAFAFLTDCDGQGKQSLYEAEVALVVTLGCDLEADLFLEGAADTALSKLGAPDPLALIAEAIEMSLPLSIVRRMAAKENVGMKHPKKDGPRGYEPKRLALADLGEPVLGAWAAATPTTPEVITEIAEILHWCESDRAKVFGVVLEQPSEFARLGCGKDALDALCYLCRKQGFLTDSCQPTDLRREIENAVSQTAFESWEVGKRLSSWERERNVSLLSKLAE